MTVCTGEGTGVESGAGGAWGSEDAEESERQQAELRDAFYAGRCVHACACVPVRGRDLVHGTTCVRERERERESVKEAEKERE